MLVTEYWTSYSTLTLRTSIGTEGSVSLILTVMGTLPTAASEFSAPD